MMTRQSPIVQASAASVIKTSWRYGGPHTIPDQTSGRTNSASSPKAPASTATESTAPHDKAASGNSSRARPLNLSFAKRATGPEHRANRSKRHMWEKRSQVTLRIFRQATRTGFWAQGSISRRDFGSSLCFCCHRQDQCGSKHIPKHTDHPEVPLLNRTKPGQPSHMPTFDVRGEPSPQGAISCLTCHEPHAGPSTPAAKTGASERRSKFLRPAEQRELCADCHGIEALWRFLYYHKDQRNPHPERKMNPLSVDTKP